MSQDVAAYMNDATQKARVIDGLPEGMAAHPELWKRVQRKGAGAIWQLVAGSEYYPDFVLLDPPGEFLKGVEKAGFKYEDRGCAAGVWAPHDTFDDICKTQEGR